MKTLPGLTPVFISFLLLAAHFSRAGKTGLIIASLLAPFMLLHRRRWVVIAVCTLLAAGALEWIRTIFTYVEIREQLGRPWLRLALILGTVALLIALSGLAFQSRKLKNHYRDTLTSPYPSYAAFLLTFSLLIFVHYKVDSIQMILLERFIPAGAWLQILILSFYAGFITEKILYSGNQAAWRQKIWAIFSAVFFAQLLLGIFVSDVFLLTGDLHLPIPAVILGGPLFRGTGFFMLILFAATLLLVGPGWCSYLCYMGSWDSAMARVKKKPASIAGNIHHYRFAMLFTFIFAVPGMRFLSISVGIAVAAALVFVAIGVLIMLVLSLRRGTMIHCTAYCPLGTVAVLAGRISPFRMKIGDNCTDCLKCIPACRYNALTKKHIKMKKPGYSCTLCADCHSACPHGAIEYSFFRKKGPLVLTSYLTLIISLHTVFLGLARI